MGRFISILAVGACLLAACTTTNTIRRPETADQLESMVWEKRAHITLLHGVPEGGRSSVPESLAVLRGAPDPDSGVPLVELSNLRGYEVERRGRGALDGLGIGAVLGLVGGALVGLATGDSDRARFFGTIGAVGGLAVGSVIGAAVGHTDRYVFSNEPAKP